MTQLSLPLIDPAAAPDPVRKTLSDLKARYGFIPNLYRIFAHAPIALDGYLALSDCYQRGTLAATERNVVLLATSRENACRYCVAVHSTVADMQKDAPQITDAIREGLPIDDARLEALRRLTQALVRERGNSVEGELSAFIDAGYSPSQVLEVIVGITLKTLSNYTNHLAETPLDDAFANRAFAKSG